MKKVPRGIYGWMVWKIRLSLSIFWSWSTPEAKAKLSTKEYFSIYWYVKLPVHQIQHCLWNYCTLLFKENFIVYLPISIMCCHYSLSQHSSNNPSFETLWQALYAVMATTTFQYITYSYGFYHLRWISYHKKISNISSKCGTLFNLFCDIM